MLELPKITIITPSLNQGRYIEETIQSVLLQDYHSLEYIILDGGSTDETMGILRKYEHRLQWISEKDKGQSQAINKGMKMATGEVIGFLNTDDLYLPGALSIVGKYFALNPTVMWATGRCRIVNAEGVEIRKIITSYKNLWLRWNNAAVLQVLNYISQPATFWRRNLVEDVGYLDENLHYAMDYDYWLRIIQKYPLRIIGENLASFRLHPEFKAGSSIPAQFDVELEIARKYTRSPALIALHILHYHLIVSIYHLLLSTEKQNSIRLSENGKRR